MRKLLTIAATILAVITVVLTTYGGEVLLGGGTTAHAATITVEQPLNTTETKTKVKVIVKDDLAEVIQSTTAESERFTIETDEVLEAKEKLEAMKKQDGRAKKVSMQTHPVVPAANLDR